MSDVVVRPADGADFDAIQRIYADAVLHTASSFELEPPSADELRQRHGRLAAGGYPFLVAEVDGELAGYCYAGPFRDRPAYRKTVEDSVYVDRRFQRRGIGSRLLRALIDECRARGFRQVIAVIGGGENVASVRLHERLGFERAGVLRAVGRKFEAWQDVCLMQRATERTRRERAERDRVGSGPRDDQPGDAA